MPHPFWPDQLKIASAGPVDTTVYIRYALKKVSGLSVSSAKVRMVLGTVLCMVQYLAARAQFCGRSMVRVKKSL